MCGIAWSAGRWRAWAWKRRPRSAARRRGRSSPSCPSEPTPGRSCSRAKSWPRGRRPAGVTAFSYRLGVGREVGRVVPMLDAGWTVPRAGEHALSLYPQLWMRLSRLGHVAASVGAEVRAVGPEPRRPRLIAFVLWDYGDAPLLHGW